MTDLLRYVQEGNMKEVLEILKNPQDGRVVINIPNEQRTFPLHIAAATGNVAMTEILLSHSAKIGCFDKDGLTPLHYAARAGQRDTCITLLKQNANIDSTTNDFWTPLHYATYHHHYDIVKLLCEFKANLTETDSKGQTPLHVACSGGCKEIIETLIRHDAEIDIQDVNHKTAIERLTINRPSIPATYSDGGSFEALSNDFRSLLYNSECSDITFVLD